MALSGVGRDRGEHTALKIHLILLTSVSRFIFQKELNTNQYLCSSNTETQKMLKATSQKSISALLKKNTAL